MTYKMAEHMINSEWWMKPNNIYIVNEDLKCLCLGEILLEQTTNNANKMIGSLTGMLSVTQ
jgi:hypothetical protein